MSLEHITADASRPIVSVVIVNWNAREFLKPCLDSVMAARDGLSLEIWVVDNASRDGSVTMLRECYPQVKVIANDENRGFAAANNQALARVRGKYAILLNPDTEIPGGTLEHMVRFLDDHPRVGIVGPRLQVLSGKIQGGAAGYEPSPWTVFNYSFFLYKLSPRLFRGLWLAQRQYLEDKPLQVDWVSGAALMVRMSAVREVGLMNEDYFMYAEDVDWCRQMRLSGWQVYCLPALHVIHHIGRSTRQRGPEFFAVNVLSLDRYYRSLYAPVVVRLLHLFGTGGFLLRTLGYEALYLLRRKAIYAELRDQWRSCLATSLRRVLGLAQLEEGKALLDEALR